MQRVRRETDDDQVRVFVGTSPGEQDLEACLVLEHSIRWRSSVPVVISRLVRLSGSDAESGWNTSAWSTPWTALRWTVPEICGWRGRAIYFDCPQVVLGDVVALASAEIAPGTFVLVKRDASRLEVACLVFDCAAAKKHLPPSNVMRQDAGAHQAVGHMLANRPELSGALPPGWGVSDSEYARDSAAVTGSVYFASPHTQPHVPLARARLARANEQHWFQGATLPHYCQPLVDLWRGQYAKCMVEEVQKSGQVCATV